MMPTLGRALPLAFAALTAATPPALSAQAPADSIQEWVIRRETQDRWIHEDRPADFVRLEESVDFFDLEGRGRSFSERWMWTATHRQLEARVDADSLGHIHSLSVRPGPLRYAQGVDSRSLHRSRVQRLRSPGGLPILPLSRFRELWLERPGTPLAAGLSWTDTLSFVAEPGEGLRESYHAVRHHRVLGDASVAGRPVVRIRTEAEVRYEARDVHVAGLELWRLERSLSGRTVGVSAVDPTSGLRVSGADTARWEGDAVLHDPEWGPLDSGVRYERTRSWTGYDPPGHRLAQDSIRAERDRVRSGMLHLPGSELEERLREDDGALADSLAARWREARDPEEAREIARLMRGFAPNDRWPRARIDSLGLDIALARGDTADALRLARRGASPRNPLTVQDVELLLAFLDNPARLWRLGEPTRDDYADAARMLLRATPLLGPDSTAWQCEPEACRRFLERLDSASDPRLRDAALVGAFARDPARWYDRLAERWDAGSAVVEEAMQRARGIAVQDGPSIPGADAGWEAWRAWWGGGPRLWQAHDEALRFYSARTGRDPVAELAARWPPAHDSAQVVFGEILRDQGAIPERSAEELRAHILSGDAPRRDAARYELPGRLREEGDDADPESVSHLLDPLVDSIFARGDAPWPAVEGVAPESGRLIHPDATSSHGVEGVPIFLLEEHLSADVLRELPPGVSSITRDAWNGRDLRAGGHLFEFRPVRRWGPFLDIRWRWTVYDRREADHVPRGFAGTGTLRLMETDEGWKVVDWGAGIT